MIPVDSHTTGGLAWQQHSMWQRHWELRSADSLMAELHFDSAFGSRATATAAGAAWTFKRSGFFSPVVTARAAGEDADIAAYVPNWTHRSGRLVVGPEELEFRQVGFWGGRWALFQQEQELIGFENTGLIHRGANVTVHEAARRRADLPLLLTLCWYLLVLYMEDAAAGGAAVQPPRESFEGPVPGRPRRLRRRTSHWAAAPPSPICSPPNGAAPGPSICS